MNPREPLTPDEQALADRLGGWSVGGPSAALDALILQQSRDAVAVAPRRMRRRPWLVSVASAAALVLTVGVVWRTIDTPRDDALFESPGVPASDMPVMREGQTLDRIEVSGSRITTPGTSALGGAATSDGGPALPINPAGDASAVADTAATADGAAVFKREPELASPAESAVVPAAPPPPPPSQAPPAVLAIQPPAPPPPPAPSATPAQEPAPATGARALEQPDFVPEPPPPPPRGSVLNRDESPSPQAKSPERAESRRDGMRASAPMPTPLFESAPADATSSGQSARQHDDREVREQDRVDPDEKGALEAVVTALDFDVQVRAIRSLVAQKRLPEARRDIAQLRRDFPRKTVPRDLRAIERQAGSSR